MENFKKYKRTAIAEMRPVGLEDIHIFNTIGILTTNPFTGDKVSISDEDLGNGSPKIGDMVARNPKNHKDQWLVAEQYFKDNFEDIG